MKAKDYFRRRAAEDEGFREEIELASTALNLARNAHRLRRALGWSQTRLAAEVGTSQPRIAELEAGAGNPTLRTLTKLARALGTEVGELVATGEVWCAGTSEEPPYNEVTYLHDAVEAIHQVHRMRNWLDTESFASTTAIDKFAPAGAVHEPTQRYGFAVRNEPQEEEDSWLEKVA